MAAYPSRGHCCQGRNHLLLSDDFNILFLLFFWEIHSCSLAVSSWGRRVARPTAADPMNTPWPSRCYGVTSEHTNRSQAANRPTRTHSKGQQCCKQSPGSPSSHTTGTGMVESPAHPAAGQPRKQSSISTHAGLHSGRRSLKRTAIPPEGFHSLWPHIHQTWDISYRSMPEEQEKGTS